MVPISRAHSPPLLHKNPPVETPDSEGREWGVGSVVVDFRVFGAPRFAVQKPPNTCFKGFWGFWTENRGAPKKRKLTTTDPTPHSRPSDWLCMGKKGSICHFARAFPASLWGHYSQVLVSTSIRGTWKGVRQWHFSYCFSQHLGILGPPNTVKQGKAQSDKSTLFCPPSQTDFNLAWNLQSHLKISIRPDVHPYPLLLVSSIARCCLHSVLSPSVTIRTASHRGAKREFPGSALGSASEGAAGNRGAPESASEGAAGNRGAPKRLSRVLFLITPTPHRSTLESTFWSTPISRSTLESTFQSTPISRSTLGNTFQSTSREFPFSTPVAALACSRARRGHE